MLVNREEVLNEDGSLGYVESIFKSSNILKTVYFAEAETLYITFGRGHTYLYTGVELDFYKRFENADSNGKFFHQHIKNKMPFYKEFTFYPHEVQELKELIENKLKEDEGERRPESD
jgi:hypothetical protein